MKKNGFFFYFLFLFLAVQHPARSQSYSIVVNGPEDNCGASATCLSVTPSGGTSFTWYASVAYPNGPSLATGPLCCPTTSGYFLCVVTDASGQHVTAPVRLRGLNPYITANGNTSSCNTSPVLLQEQVSYVYQINIFDTYQWFLNGTAIPGANSWYYYAQNTGTYTLRVGISCGAALSNPIPVTIYNPIPAATSITASGPTTFCSGGAVTLNVPAIGSYYQWKRNGVNITGATGPSYSASASGNYSCNLANNCNSVTTTAITVTVNPVPSATLTASGPLTFCSGGNVQLSAATGNGYAYVWKQNGNIIVGATSATYVATTGGSYYVEVTSSGCSSTSSSINVVVNPYPVATVTASGPVTLCAGGSVQLNASTGNGYSYVWKKNGTVISGAIAATYAAAVSGTYTVDITLAGCTTASAGTNVNINPLPSVSFSGLASSYTCQSPPDQLAGLPSGGTFSGPGVSGSLFQPSSLSNGGPYAVSYTYTDNAGCSTTATQSASVVSGFNCLLPQNLTVTGVTGTTVSLRWVYSSSSQYQIRYRKTGTATYTVKTISATACQNSYTLTGLKKNTTYEIGIRSYCSSATASAYGNTVNFTTPVARLDMEEEADWAVYPNPAESVFSLKVPKEYRQTHIVVRIIDSTGRVTGEYSMPHTEQPLIATERLAPGIYLVNVSSLDGTRLVDLRLVVQ